MHIRVRLTSNCTFSGVLISNREEKSEYTKSYYFFGRALMKPTVIVRYHYKMTIYGDLKKIHDHMFDILVRFARGRPYKSPSKIFFPKKLVSPPLTFHGACFTVL